MLTAPPHPISLHSHQHIYLREPFAGHYYAVKINNFYGGTENSLPSSLGPTSRALLFYFSYPPSSSETLQVLLSLQYLKGRIVYNNGLKNKLQNHSARAPAAELREGRVCRIPILPTRGQHLHVCARRLRYLAWCTFPEGPATVNHKDYQQTRKEGSWPHCAYRTYSARDKVFIWCFRILQSSNIVQRGIIQWGEMWLTSWEKKIVFSPAAKL